MGQFMPFVVLSVQPECSWVSPGHCMEPTAWHRSSPWNRLPQPSSQLARLERITSRGSESGLFARCLTRPTTTRPEDLMRENSGMVPLLHKVCTYCFGDFSWGLFVDPEVVQFWECLRFRSWEDCCKPLHSHLSLCGLAFPAIHEQDARRYFPIVLITIVKASHFLMLMQIFLEEAQDLLALTGPQEKWKQPLHEPGRCFACGLRVHTSDELNKCIKVLLLGKFLLVAWYPAYRDGPINRDAGLVHGYFGER